ncbi:MAG: hypothetical protein NT031_06760 [Planctomycetota bacterium]|nr:hypothetical protein [Planctomycetota bacterium]
MVLVALAVSATAWRGAAAQTYAWDPADTKADLMVVGTHLDDEGIYLGGTMPYYAGALGKSTVHISMTSGDSSVPTATREAESRAVDWSYGVRIEPVYAHFKDWGMGSQSPYTKGRSIARTDRSGRRCRRSPTTARPVRPTPPSSTPDA